MTTMESIREWYRSQPPWVRTVNFWFWLFFAFAHLVALTKSGPEFGAIAWHYRHGNQVTVNGVMFPVYVWYAPESGHDWFHVFDQPGPLRRMEDTFTMFSINGRRGKDDAGAPEELVQRAMGTHSRYSNLTRFQGNVRSQLLEYMQERIGSVSVVSCYGDGPIYSVFFNGDVVALDRLKRLISDAK
jgi:hypothetical protein